MKFFKMIFSLSARPLRSRAPARHTGAPPRRSAERAPVGRRRALPRTARLRGNNQCQSALCAKSVARAYARFGLCERPLCGLAIDHCADCTPAPYLRISEGQGRGTLCYFCITFWVFNYQLNFPWQSCGHKLVEGSL